MVDSHRAYKSPTNSSSEEQSQLSLASLPHIRPTAVAMQPKLALFTLSSMLLASFGSVAAAPAAEPEVNALAARVSPLAS